MYSNGPVPSGILATVPALIALVDSIARLTEVRPSRTEVSAVFSTSLTLYLPSGTTLVTEPT